MKPYKTYQFKTSFISLFFLECMMWSIVLYLYFYFLKPTDSFRFERPDLLYLLWWMPLHTIIFVCFVWWRSKKIHSFATLRTLGNATTPISTSRSIIKHFCLRWSFFFIIIALSNPQYGMAKRTVENKGIDIMVALDVSKSMLAEDLVKGYNRLKIAKMAISQLLDKLQGDRLGLVVFAGDAYKQIPITPDYFIAKMFLKNIETNVISSQGTNIALALEKCESSFDLKSTTNKVIIVLSDGEDHEQYAIEKARELAQKGIQIYTIGMGTTQGVPIPENKNGRLKKDKDGNTVLTKLNESYLQNIAKESNGLYIRASGMDLSLNAILDNINDLEKKTWNTQKYTIYDDQFQLYAWIGCILFLISHLFAISPISIKKIIKTSLFCLALISIYTAQVDEKIEFNKGVDLYKKGDFKNAKSHFDAKDKTSPHYAKGLFNKGNALYMQGDFENASKQYKNYIKHVENPLDKSKGYYNAANAYFKEFKQNPQKPNTEALKKSIEHYKKALRLNPKDEQARKNLTLAIKNVPPPPPPQKNKNKKDDKKNNKKDKQQNKKQSDKKQDKSKKDKKKNKNDKKGDKNKQNKPQKKQGKQPMKASLKDALKQLDAMNKDEQKILKKINRSKTKKQTNSSEKDW